MPNDFWKGLPKQRHVALPAPNTLPPGKRGLTAADILDPLAEMMLLPPPLTRPAPPTKSALVPAFPSAPPVSVELDGADPFTFLTDNGASVQIEEPAPRVLKTDQDFDDYLLSQAREAAGGDDLDEAATLRSLHDQVDQTRAPSVSMTPRSWDRGRLGDTQPVGNDVNITADGLPVLLVHWPGDDRETTAVSLTVAPILTPGQNPGLGRAVARIIWGTQDGKFQCDVDIGTGVQLTLVASNVYVYVLFLSGITTPLNQKFSGAISFQRLNPTNRSTLTDYIDALAGGGSITIPRPQFGNTIQNFSRSNFTDAWTIVGQGTVGGAVVTIMTIVIAASTQPQLPIYLPNDVSSLVITNSGAGAGNARVVFGVL